MGDINHWYADQFCAKLSEWNIQVPASFTKAELKSLYLANTSSRSSTTRDYFSLRTVDTMPNSNPLPPLNGTSTSNSQTGNNSVKNKVITVNSVISVIKEVLHTCKDEKEDVCKDIRQVYPTKWAIR